jgi:hypothetical protein
MSILLVAIVPPHLTVLSMRMAVAIYVTGISIPEVHLESPPLLGTLTAQPEWRLGRLMAGVVALQLWVLPLLTCGHSVQKAANRVVRGF